MMKRSSGKTVNRFTGRKACRKGTGTGKLYYVLCILFVLVFVHVRSIYAQSGSLYDTFADSGIYMASFPIEAFDVAVQTNGKILVAGSTNGNFALMRFNSDGSVDNTFSGDGLVTTDLGEIQDAARSIIVQQDGKIIVAGHTGDGGLVDLALVRYSSDGHLDNTFSDDGIQITDLGNNYDYCNAAALQDDGKIVLVGSTGNYHTNDDIDFAVVRYNSDGSLDNTFSNDGIQINSIGDGYARAHDVAIQSDNKIVVAGRAVFESTSIDITLIRYLSNGSLDNTFSGDGIQTTAIGTSEDYGYALAIQPDDKIVVAGGALGEGIAVLRYNSDGDLDNSFHNDGIRISDIDGDIERARSLLLQPDGKIVVTGFCSNGTDNDLAMIRYYSNGNHDTHFGDNGVQITDIGGNDEEIYASAFDSNNDIVAVGHSNDTLALLKYHGMCNTHSYIDVTACDRYVRPSGGPPLVYSVAFTDVIPNAEGCDSIIHIDLTIKKSSSSAIERVVCEEYTVPSGDETYTNSGTYTDTIPNMMGCDSIITIELTVKNQDIKIIQDENTLYVEGTYDSYQWLNCDKNYEPVEGQTSDTFSMASPGNYAVEVTNEYLDNNDNLIACTDTSACYEIHDPSIYDFKKGINLTNWFQTNHPGEIQHNKYTKQDFENIKSLGCDIIRLPINLHDMTSGAPDYTVDPLLFEFLDRAVDWAEELELNLILDNHSWDPFEPIDAGIEDVLLEVWPQVAERYKDRSMHLLYEVLNEPHGISDSTWNAIQGQVITAIRAVDTTHYIIVTPANWSSAGNFDQMPEYSDDRLIYTFHFYEPHLFTHQGATWISPSLEALSGVPFPHDADTMPGLPASIEGSWLEGQYNNYENLGTGEHLRDMLDVAVQFKNNRDVPVYCGEFGVVRGASKNEHRVAWYDTVVNYLDRHDISRTSWDYHGIVGLFDENGQGLFDHDLNVPLLEALNFNVPGQTTFNHQPETSGFPIYTDSIEDGFYESNTFNEGFIHYYIPDDPYTGEHCLEWSGAEIYNWMGFDARPDIDMSQLVSEGYGLDFYMRTSSADKAFDVRFLDTKTDDPDDHPWRIRYRIDESLVPADGQWHHVHIPLSDFVEEGAFDQGQWYDPVGDFDWSAIDRFEIVAQLDSLTDAGFWFDNIRVVKPADDDDNDDGDNGDNGDDDNNNDDNNDDNNNDPTSTRGTGYTSELKVYPNPAKDRLHVVLPEPDVPASMRLISMDNKEVFRMKVTTPAIEIDVSAVEPGIYMLMMNNEEKVRNSKIVIW